MRRLCNTHAARAKPPDSMASNVEHDERYSVPPGLEIERGDFATRTSAAEGSRRLVLVTFNIRYAVGSHLIGGSLLRRVGLGRPGRRPWLVGQNIRQAAGMLSDGTSLPRADVVALQEADRGTLRAGGRHVARELAAELQMNYVRAHVPTPADVEPGDRKWWLEF
ncbi:MAG TPA: hypothetical protein VE360_07645, partial [Pyrinomonadaceae bacterium]|nr:hypothetical protein [Pyrinomonadaceae bacterium]